MTEAADDRTSTGPAALDLEQLARAESELSAVEYAMSRLDAGTWGTCEACAGPIEPALLAQRPTVRTCAVHV